MYVSFLLFPSRK